MALGLIAIAPAAWAAPAPPPAKPPAVGVVAAEPTAITPSDTFVGRIEAVNHVAVLARVTAFLDRQLFVDGSEVHKGEELFVLERGPFEAAVRQQAAAVAQVQANQANDQLKYNRAATLLNTPAGQRSTVDDTRAQLLSDQAQLMAAQAQLRAAEINLAYTEIDSPIDGKIGRALITPGNVVSPSSGTLATIVSQDPMYVSFPVSRSASLQLRDRYASNGGLSAVTIRVQLQDGKMYEQAGKLVFVDNSVDQTTDTILFRASIANPVRAGFSAGQPGARELFDGQFVTVLVEGVKQEQALGVPRAAVLSDQTGDYVYTVDAGDVARRTTVVLGQSTPTMATVLKGLTEGQRVVVDGVQRVREDHKVSPGPASSAPSVAAPAGGASPRPATPVQ